MVKFLFSMILCSLLHLPPAAFLSLSVDDHMLFPNQTLVDNGQTLVSRNQVFEMDFFSPGKSSSRFLGIWYTNTPEVVVCVANGINPISASQAPVFLVSRTGNLVLTSGKGITWSMNSSGMATNPVLHLLDFGNLVLEKCRDECLKNCSCTADKGCLTCFGELVDARGLSSGEINHEHCPHLGILHAVDNTGSEKETEKKRTMKLMLISIASGVLVSAIIINGGLHFTARRKSRGNIKTSVPCSCSNR